MASWEKLVTETINALIEINGAGTVGESGLMRGRRLPRTSAIDALTMLATISPALVGAVDRVSYKGRAWPVDVADEEGVYDVSKLDLAVDPGISGKAYVAGYPSPLAPYWRSTAAVTRDGRVVLNTSRLYAPALEKLTLGGEQTNMLAMLRESMRDWQSAVDAATALALATPMDLSAMQTGPGVEVFWRAAQRLANGIAVIAEAPESDRFAVIKGALKSSTSITAELVAKEAGELAAHVAEVAGNTAGTFADSFFSSAGLTALAVGGIAVYMVAR